MVQCYGLTETTGIVTMCDVQAPLLHDSDGVDNEPSWTSIGRLIPCAEARIMDVESGEALPPNRTGELWLRSPCLMQGYLRNEEATAAALVRDASSCPEEEEEAAGRWL